MSGRGLEAAAPARCEENPSKTDSTNRAKRGGVAEILRSKIIRDQVLSPAQRC